jgi:hypothetical protein
MLPLQIRLRRRGSNRIDPNGALFRPFGAGRTPKEMFLQRCQFWLNDHAEIALQIVIGFDNVLQLHAALVIGNMGAAVRCGMLANISHEWQPKGPRVGTTIADSGDVVY